MLNSKHLRSIGDKDEIGLDEMNFCCINDQLCKDISVHQTELNLLFLLIYFLRRFQIRNPGYK